MKIVVTGALGHIGSRLVRELPRFFPYTEILMIDNFSTQRYASLFNLPEGANFRFVEGDVTSMDIYPFFSGVDAVVHLAALTDATKSFDEPEQMEHVNFTATKRVAEACAQAGVPMTHISSTSVYGTKKEKVDENCGPEDINPQSPYAVSKLREENLVAEMYKRGSLKALTFRFGTIFGISPGMRFHTAVNKFCWQAVMGQPLTVWRTALDQVRPYLDLNDAIHVIAKFIDMNRFDGRVYNVVSVNVAVRQVIEAIRKHIPALEINLVDSRVMNEYSFGVSNTRLVGEGFSVKGDLSVGIRQTIAMLQNANFMSTKSA